jgi:hypothetical protein
LSSITAEEKRGLLLEPFSVGCRGESHPTDFPDTVVPFRVVELFKWGFDLFSIFAFPT